MDWGLHFPSHIHSWQWVKHGEDRGFSFFMPYDSIGSDVYETLALCAANTDKIMLGPGVTSPRSRTAPVTARAMATLNELAPGRCILGVGTGNTARRAFGMPPATPDEVREFIDVCRKMMRGEEALYTEGPDPGLPEERKRYVKLLSPDMNFVNTGEEVPVYIAGSGPVMLQMAGELGDGVMLLGAIGESFLDYCMGHIREGAKRAGRDPGDVYTVVLAGAHILEGSQTLDSPEVRQAIGPIVAVCLNITALSVRNYNRRMGKPEGEPLPEDIRRGIMAFADAYETGDVGPERRHLNYYGNYFFWNESFDPLITPEMIKASALVGTPGEITDTIKRMEDQGVSQVMIAPLPDPVSAIDAFSSQVIAGY